MKAQTFIWKTNHLDVLDQRLLPHKVVYIPCKTPTDAYRVIKEMAVRGAPAIGCVAAYGMALALRSPKTKNPIHALKKAGQFLKTSRPTAVNLAWGVDRMIQTALKIKSWPVPKMYKALK